ncbi:AMP-binding protein [Carboxylicivirga mesophila]|uniref:AMP-binding protein n=1 Tax=Carboxylicivirga mesophila TaxID=1166478 RepID=A0ABS5K8H8_9BACT|nr:AMP-binding protein [Carboxylicivirga mesophila]MBS2210811.1 AMP-binding protein [Carboxylicivirga mesophila]
MMDRMDSYKQYDELLVDGEQYCGIASILTWVQKLEATNQSENLLIARFIRDWFDDKAYIKLQTSGSTGQPKTIKVHKQSMVASAHRTIRFFNLQQGDSALLCLSAKYIAGKMMLVRALVGGLDVVITNINSNPLQQINRVIGFAAMVPMQLHNILSNTPGKLQNIKQLIVGGGSVNPLLLDQLSGLTTEVWETYGMTETVSHIALRNLSNGDEMFKLLPGLVIDVDSRGCLKVLPSDINTDTLFTNDMVKLESSTQFRLLGRWDNVINTGGVKVIPELIEAKLKSVIKEDFIISWKPDDILGQRVVLVLESDSQVGLDDMDLSMMSKYEQPKEVVAVSCFPKTETGKIQRLKLRELLG